MMRKKNRLIALLSLLLLSLGCSENEMVSSVQPEPSGRGAVVSTDSITTYSAAFIQASLSFFNPQLSTLARYSVSLYKIVYKTIDADGSETRASGLLAIPQQAGAPPLASYQHGTLAKKSEAPSTLSGLESAIGFGFASTGYITLLPDYLGLGDSPLSLHYFVHSPTLASATIDMIRASKTVCAKKSISFSDSLFLFGYSEGGYATMATHKTIEENFADEFRLIASAPMAGPYDLADVMATEMLKNEPVPSPGYAPFVMLAYQKIYNVFQSLSDPFPAPYSTTLPQLFEGGALSLPQINAQIPQTPRLMLNESFILDFETNPSNKLRTRLRENNNFDWSPRAPMRLFHSTQDDQVPFENSVKAYNAMRDCGASGVILDTSASGLHSQAAIPFLISGLYWFDALRNKTALARK
jgi:hypothetical protein